MLRAPLSFNVVGAKVSERLVATATAMRRNRALIQRLEATRRRTDTRDWILERRERTRHLIELGGLVQKAGLVDLTDDDRATIYGALLELVGKARREDAGDTLGLWKRRGKRAFDIEAERSSIDA